MPEPSLSEITNIAVDPERGSGTPATVIDNSGLVNNLQQGARAYAENKWKQYNTFLKNKQDLFANLDKIQDLAVATQDKPLLNKMAGDILSEILKNPSAATGGKGYDDIQAKLAKFKSEAMLSKQNKLDDDTNGLFMDRNPELYTDENKAKRENFWKAPLGARQPVMLDMPTIFDEKVAFEGLLKENTRHFADVVGPNWEPEGEGYLGSGEEINPNAIGQLWNLALKGQKDKYGHSIMGAVKKNYENLPEAEKALYEKSGGIEQYFADRGKQYLDAYFPEGSYEKTKEGNYRFGKKLAADPNYLRGKILAHDIADDAEGRKIDRAKLSLGWANYGLNKSKIDDADTEDLLGADVVLNEAISILNNATVQRTVNRSGNDVKEVLRISDPTLLQTFGNVDKDGKVTNIPDAINYDTETNQPTLLYFRTRTKAELDALKKSGREGNQVYEKEIPLDQRTWLKHITKRSFPNKDVGKINILLEDVLKKNENSLYKLSKKVTPSTTTPTPAKLTSKGLPIIK